MCIRDSSQEETEESAKGPAAWATLPWKEWPGSAASQDLAAKEADIGAALMVLRRLHVDPKMHETDVDVLLCDTTGKKRVVCSADIPEGTLELPPCIPKSCKLHTTSIHEGRVQITIERKIKPSGNDSDRSRGSESVTNTYYIQPEWKQPSDDRTDVQKKEAPTTNVWNWAGDETLHPFWAVRRMTEEEKEKASTPSVPLLSLIHISEPTRPY